MKREKIAASQTHAVQRVGANIPGRGAENTRNGLESLQEKPEDGTATPDHNDLKYERGPPQPPTGVAIDGGGRARSLHAGADPTPQRLDRNGYRFESCIAHSSTLADVLRHTAQILLLTADVIGSAPGKGTGRDAGTSAEGTDE